MDNRLPEGVWCGVKLIQKRRADCLSYFHTSEIYKIKFHLLNHWVNEVRGLGDISVLEEFVKEQSSFHTREDHQRSLERLEIHMQEIVRGI